MIQDGTAQFKLALPRTNFIRSYYAGNFRNKKIADLKKTIESFVANNLKVGETLFIRYDGNPQEFFDGFASPTATFSSSGYVTTLIVYGLHAYQRGYAHVHMMTYNNEVYIGRINNGLLEFTEKVMTTKNGRRVADSIYKDTNDSIPINMNGSSTDTVAFGRTVENYNGNGFSYKFENGKGRPAKLYADEINARFRGDIRVPFMGDINKLHETDSIMSFNYTSSGTKNWTPTNTSDKWGLVVTARQSGPDCTQLFLPVLTSSGHIKIRGGSASATNQSLFERPWRDIPYYDEVALKTEAIKGVAIENNALAITKGDGKKTTLTVPYAGRTGIDIGSFSNLPVNDFKTKILEKINEVGECPKLSLRTSGGLNVFINHLVKNTDGTEIIPASGARLIELFPITNYQGGWAYGELSDYSGGQKYAFLIRQGVFSYLGKFVLENKEGVTEIMASHAEKSNGTGINLGNLTGKTINELKSKLIEVANSKQEFQKIVCSVYGSVGTFENAIKNNTDGTEVMSGSGSFDVEIYLSNIPDTSGYFFGKIINHYGAKETQFNVQKGVFKFLGSYVLTDNTGVINTVQPTNSSPDTQVATVKYVKDSINEVKKTTESQITSESEKIVSGYKKELSNYQQLVEGKFSDIEYSTLQRNTSYDEGDIVYSKHLPPGYYLKCTKSGTTGQISPNIKEIMSTGGY